MCIKAVTTAIEGLDGVQSVSVKKGATSTITMKAGKTLTKEVVQAKLSAVKDNSPYKVTTFAEAKVAEPKKADDTPKKKDADEKKSGK